MNATRCICYVASTEGYLDEVMASLASLRTHMPDISVAVVTLPELFRSNAPVSDWIELPTGLAGPIVKSAARLAPYGEVLFLDSDTTVTSDLADIFSILGAFDLAAALELPREDCSTPGVPDAFPEFNTGVLAFRNDEAVGRLFSRWLEQHRQLGRLSDQPSFRAAVWSTPEIRVAALSSNYNFVPCNPAVIAGKINVLHDRSLGRPALLADLNRTSEMRAFVPGWGSLSLFRGRWHWIRQYWRLSRNFIRVLLDPGTIEPKGDTAPVHWWKPPQDHNVPAERSKD